MGGALGSGISSMVVQNGQCGRRVIGGLRGVGGMEGASGSGTSSMVVRNSRCGRRVISGLLVRDPTGSTFCNDFVSSPIPLEPSTDVWAPSLIPSTVGVFNNVCASARLILLVVKYIFCNLLSTRHCRRVQNKDFGARDVAAAAGSDCCRDA